MRYSKRPIRRKRMAGRWFLWNRESLIRYTIKEPRKCAATIRRLVEKNRNLRSIADSHYLAFREQQAKANGRGETAKRMVKRHRERRSAMEDYPDPLSVQHKPGCPAGE